MNKLETAPNLGTTEYSCDEMMQKNTVNAVYPVTGSQYFVLENPNTHKLFEIQAKRITRFLQKQVEKILHDNMEENNPKE